MKRSSFWVLLGGLTLATWVTLGGSSNQPDKPSSAIPTRPVVSDPTTKPIETIRVGDRVLARNPEITDAERATWVEPDFTRWVHLSLELALPGSGGGVISIEMLRPQDWVGRHVRREQRGDSRVEIVRLQLPEFGVQGDAVLLERRPCSSPVTSSSGHVVTATFAHPPTTQVWNVRFEGENDPIGVTDNHLFWSVDRGQFKPIGEFEIGEWVRTFRGETKRIESRLARPSPATVYNLEVYGEHVYYVGQSGLLVHNSYSRAGVDEAIERGELSVVNASRAGVSRGSNIHEHHLLPQEHREFFHRMGIDVDDYVVDIDRAAHEAIHGGGDWRLGREWADNWNELVMREIAEEMAARGGDLSADEILELVSEIARRQKISTDTHRYTRARNQ